MMGFKAGGVFLGLLALSAVLATSATAATWKVTNVEDGQTEGIFFGISCPSDSLCVAVGTNSTIATSTDPSGDASAWKTVHPEGYFESPIPGGGKILYQGNQVRGVSCPSVDLCVAASRRGNIFSSTNPTGNVSAWKVAELGMEAIHMHGISCPSSSLCVAVAYNGRIVTSTDPTGDADAWKVTRLPGSHSFRGISCPSVSLCVAVDNEGNIHSSTDPTGGPEAWNVAKALGGLNGISCPSSSLCVTGNATQMITSTNPSEASSWIATNSATGLPVKGVSCPAVAACAAVDNNADLLTSTDPTGGPAAWSFVNVIPPVSASEGSPNGMYGISCPSESFCAAAGTRYQLILSTDPFAVEKTKDPIVRKSKRPRVKITWHPAKRVNPRRGGAKVTFRFKATGTKASRFRCKLGGHRRSGRKLSGGFSTCESPKRYRLGRGKYVFKVFAIGLSGARGPVSAVHFRVGHFVEPQPPSTCAATSAKGKLPPFDYCVPQR